MLKLNGVDNAIKAATFSSSIKLNNSPIFEAEKLHIRGILQEIGFVSISDDDLKEWFKEGNEKADIFVNQWLKFNDL